MGAWVQTPWEDWTMKRANKQTSKHTHTYHWASGICLGTGLTLQGHDAVPRRFLPRTVPRRVSGNTTKRPRAEILIMVTKGIARDDAYERATKLMRKFTPHTIDGKKHVCGCSVRVFAEFRW